MKTKHFQLTEAYRGDKPHVIGTIPNVVNSQAGREAFEVRFNTAVGEHFDLNNINHTIISFDEMFEAGFSETNIIIEDDDGKHYEVEITETWLY